MALITTLQCSCGIEWLIYVPKTVLYKEILRGGGVGLGKMIDEHERDRGEVALARETAKLREVEFRDITINEIIQCQCGRVFDMLRIIDLDIKYFDMGVLNYEEVKVPQYEL